MPVPPGSVRATPAMTLLFPSAWSTPTSVFIVSMKATAPHLHPWLWRLDPPASAVRAGHREPHRASSAGGRVQRLRTFRELGVGQALATRGDLGGHQGGDAIEWVKPFFDAASGGPPPSRVAADLAKSTLTCLAAYLGELNRSAASDSLILSA